MLGASFDTPEENKSFADDQQFSFRLLSDVGKTVGRTYEVVRGPGEKYPDFPLRVAYLIDPGGVIAKSYLVSDPATFAGEALTDIEDRRSQGEG